MITTDIYVQIGQDEPITHRIETVDGVAHIVIGGTGSGTALVLTLVDPDMCRRLAEGIMAAHADFVRQVLERRLPISARGDGTLTVVR